MSCAKKLLSIASMSCSLVKSVRQLGNTYRVFINLFRKQIIRMHYKHKTRESFSILFTVLSSLPKLCLSLGEPNFGKKLVTDAAVDTSCSCRYPQEEL